MFIPSMKKMGDSRPITSQPHSCVLDIRSSAPKTVCLMDAITDSQSFGARHKIRMDAMAKRGLLLGETRIRPGGNQRPQYGEGVDVE